MSPAPTTSGAPSQMGQGWNLVEEQVSEQHGHHHGRVVEGGNGRRLGIAIRIGHQQLPKDAEQPGADDEPCPGLPSASATLAAPVKAAQAMNVSEK